MKKSQLLILILCSVISSCGYKFSIQKRRYGNGFFIASTNSKNSFEKSSKANYYKKTETTPTETNVEFNEVTTPLTEKKDIATGQIFIKNNEKNAQQKDIKKTPNSLSPIKSEIKKDRINKKIKNKNNFGGLLEIIEDIYIAYIFIAAIILIASALIYLFSVFPPLQAILIIVVGILILALLAGLGAAIRY